MNEDTKDVAGSISCAKNFLGLVVQAVIVALGEWSQEDLKFKASLGYMSHTTASRLSVFARPCGRSYYRNENMAACSAGDTVPG